MGEAPSLMFLCAPMAPSTILDTQLLVNRHLWDGNTHRASRANCTSARSQAQCPEEAAPAPKAHGILGFPLHHYKDRPPPCPIARGGSHPLPGTVCVSANSERSVGQTTLLPWDSCCSQASMSEVTRMVTPPRKPPTPMIPSTQQQPGQAQLCPQRSPGQLATQQAVSLLQIKGPNLNLYLRYHKWVSALQAGQHS